MIHLLLPKAFICFRFTGLMASLVPGISIGSQGLEGYVYRVSGNQMPSPDRKPAQPKGMKTTLYIFQLTNIREVSRQDHTSFFSVPGSRLVKKVQTNKDGYFRVELPAGKYSVFTKKDEWFYANWFDADNNIAPATVLPGKITRIEVRVDYDASY